MLPTPEAQSEGGKMKIDTLSVQAIREKYKVQPKVVYSRKKIF